MSSGLLSLRKLQIRTLRDSVKLISRKELVDLYIRAEINRQELAYALETADDMQRIVAFARALLPKIEENMASGELRCIHCGAAPTGFKDKQAANYFQLLRLCQACQDNMKGPDG